jgi:protein-disulfide isomerase
VVLGAAAFAVFGVMVALSLAGGAQGSFEGVPQNGTTLGREDAPVTIRLYEDFQCPACGLFARETVPKLVESRVKTSEAKLIAKPLAIFPGPDSVAAARAALAAGEQDRYWQYSALLFENQAAENSGYVTDEFLTNLAEKTEDLNVGAWNEARKDPALEGALKDAARRTTRAGVSSTPTIVISGPGGERTIRGAVSADEVEAAIDEVKGS